MENTKERIVVSPDVCSYTSEDNTRLIFEITIPGVEKENIDLKVLDDSFTLRAPREEIEFAVALSFCCPVKSEDVKAEYHNGLLRIDAPYRDLFEKAIRVKVA